MVLLLHWISSVCMYVYLWQRVHQTWLNYDGHHLKYASRWVSIVAISAIVISSKGDYAHILLLHSAYSKRSVWKLKFSMNNSSNYFYKYLIRIHSQLYKKKLLRIVKIHDSWWQFAIQNYLKRENRVVDAFKV